MKNPGACAPGFLFAWYFEDERDQPCEWRAMKLS